MLAQMVAYPTKLSRSAVQAGLHSLRLVTDMSLVYDAYGWLKRLLSDFFVRVREYVDDQAHSSGLSRAIVFV